MVLRGELPVDHHLAGRFHTNFQRSITADLGCALSPNVAKYRSELQVTDLGNPSPAKESWPVHAIEALAREAHVPVERVSDIYSRELKQLTARARVREFLPLLTLRRVKVILREQVRLAHPG
jgi:hypothetical protein